MADASLLSVLAGTDPLSPQILDALHAEQARGMVSDPANWQNQGLAGGIARTLAGFLAPSAAPQVAQIAGQRVAAQPDEAKLLASPDPFAEIRDHPDQYSGLARAMVLNGANPASVAEARLKAAQAALAQAQVGVTGQAGGLISNMLSQNGGAGVQALANAGQPNAVPSEGDNPGSLAMAQPPAVQEMVAKKIATTDGLQHWAGIDPNTGKPWNQPLRAAFQMAGLPVAGPISEEQWAAAKPLILQYESYGGKNVPNNHFDSTHTAGGPFQITNSTWRAFGGPAGSLNTGPVTGIAQGGPQAPIRLAQNGGPTSLPGAPQNAGPSPQGPGAPPGGPSPAAISAGAVPPPAQPQAPGSAPRNYPGYPNLTPEHIAALGAAGAAVGRDFAKPFEQLYYNSPEYLQRKALADKMGANQQTLGPNGEIQNMPGAVESGAQKAGAIAGAQADQKIEITRDGAIYKGGVYVGHAPKMTDIVDPNTGAKYPAFTPPIGAVAPNMAPPSAPGAEPLPQGGAPAAKSGTAAPPGAVMAAPSALGPGQTEALKTRAEEEQKQRQLVIKEANDAQQSRATLQNMANEANNFHQGPFAPFVQKAATYLRMIDPSFNGQVASYEDFVKNAGNLTRQAVRETTARAAVQEFNMIQNTLPSPEMSPQGMQRITNELLGLNDFKLAKAQAQQQWERTHGGTGNVADFETTFQKQASPYAFIVARMDPQYRQELFAKLQGSEEGRHELSRLGEQLTFIKQSGISPHQ